MALNYVYILLFWEQLVIYFNNDNIAQECSAKIYIQITDSLCNGSNSLRVQEQLI